MENCQEIKDRIMFFLDNELPEKDKELIISHLNQCKECSQYLKQEELIKNKICQKIKDAYVCKCDLDSLREQIENKLGNIL
jgi:hypothetical protein